MNLALKDLRVLVVDNAPHMRDLLCGLLHAVGVGVIETANDGGDALGKFKTFPADIILSDWEMEPMTGVEFVQAVRHSVRSPNPFVPIIMVTSHAEADRVLEARDAGIHEYLVKPITAQALLARLSEVINNPRDFMRTSTYFGPVPRRRADIAQARAADLLAMRARAARAEA